MIGYVSLGTNDMPRALAFYDELLGTLGAKRLMEFDNAFYMYGVAEDQPMLAICKPFDGKAATVGNGVMVALMVKDQAQVKALYAKAMELGSADEGKPGERAPNFYAAYFRDPDGNKLNAFCTGA